MKLSFFPFLFDTYIRGKKQSTEFGAEKQLLPQGKAPLVAQQ